MAQIVTSLGTYFISAKIPDCAATTRLGIRPWRSGARALWARNPGPKGLSRGGEIRPLVWHFRFRDRSFQELQSWAEKRLQFLRKTFGDHPFSFRGIRGKHGIAGDGSRLRYQYRTFHPAFVLDCV